MQLGHKKWINGHKGQVIHRADAVRHVMEVAHQWLVPHQWGGISDRLRGLTLALSLVDVCLWWRVVWRGGGV